ncbi:uncharacterized protein LOC129566396 [Sitodiplosis mosellana]|uniref:uncharacterized protein LOC129566396 n=1 Tax=Sitodiplosis mosellana TaxID=263140 RepID=UPI0024447ADB|nr:uncharacterized protein LOC129566396 [Sitodiplosis mosellana]
MPIIHQFTQALIGLNPNDDEMPEEAVKVAKIANDNSVIYGLRLAEILNGQILQVTDRPRLIALFYVVNGMMKNCSLALHEFLPGIKALLRTYLRRDQLEDIEPDVEGWNDYFG